MTVNELREMLEGLDGDVEVRIALQPSYPLQSSIAGITDVQQPEPKYDGDPKPAPCVYILEGSSEGYASRDLWDI